MYGMIELDERPCMGWVLKKDGHIAPVDLEGRDGAVILFKYAMEEDGNKFVNLGYVENRDDGYYIKEYKDGGWIIIAYLDEVDRYMIIDWLRFKTSMERSLDEIAAVSKRCQEESKAVNDM